MKKHAAVLAVLMLAVLAAPVALAAEGTSPPDSILSSLLTPGVVGTGLSIIAGAIGLFAGGTWLNARRKRILALAALHAFNIIEDVAAENPERNGWDKAAEGLKVANEWMLANGWRALKLHEQEAMKLSFRAIHGEQKASAKAQGTALTSALGAIGSVAALASVGAAVPQMPRG